MKKLLFTILAVLCLWFTFTNITHASSSDEAVSGIVVKIMDRISDKSDTEKVTFLNVIITALDAHAHRHPIIPTLQDKLSDKVLLLEWWSDSNLYFPVSYSIDWVNMDDVKAEWLKWYNDLRASQGLHAYKWNAQLDATAQEWAYSLSVRNASIQGWDSPQGGTHWRESADEGYYNSTVINGWFSDRGVNQSVTENVWYWGYSCSSTNCTDKMIDSVRGTYTFFESEKDWNGPHWRSMVSEYYDEVWFGLVVEPWKNKYWLVVHYGDAD